MILLLIVALLCAVQSIANIAAGDQKSAAIFAAAGLVAFSLALARYERKPKTWRHCPPAALRGQK